MKVQYTFSSKVWKYQGQAGWFFVSLPQHLSEEIRTLNKTFEEGWGRLKTSAQLGSSNWQTAIWFDTKLNTYLLPIKTDVRKKEQITINQIVTVIIYI